MLSPLTYGLADGTPSAPRERRFLRTRSEVPPRTKVPLCRAVQTCVLGNIIAARSMPGPRTFSERLTWSFPAIGGEMRAAQPTRLIRVLVADNSAIHSELLSEALEGTAASR